MGRGLALGCDEPHLGNATCKGAQQQDTMAAALSCCGGRLPLHLEVLLDFGGSYSLADLSFSRREKSVALFSCPFPIVALFCVPLHCPPHLKGEWLQPHVRANDSLRVPDSVLGRLCLQVRLGMTLLHLNPRRAAPFSAGKGPKF